jgi:hypothetical protein
LWRKDGHKEQPKKVVANDEYLLCTRHEDEHCHADSPGFGRNLYDRRHDSATSPQHETGKEESTDDSSTKQDLQKSVVGP